ncbi:hypothetical protein Salat_0559200 [Sesamum alatum]|uniref:Uncharacterized protein n=1 Tax=Sesamum alatum TaxID=300844 RepID=A0AAE1YP15_9LAMI|nr:hypothetical protein Salat_0559200 [Sesamum alatum]
MATEVLRPQDLLGERFRVPQASCPRRRNIPANGSLTHLDANRRQHRKTSPKPDKRRFNAAAETKRSSHGGVSDLRQRDEVSGGLVMGQVTLLRRGESLSSLASKVTGGSAEAPAQKPVDDLAVLGTVRIGPDLPEMVPKQIRLGAPSTGDVYAGSAFFSSPSPRSVPLPSFFNKRDSDDCQSEPFDDGATRDLRRLLRLE